MRGSLPQAEIGSPDPDRPDCGRLLFGVECSPVASPAFRGRGGDELASELARALERSMYPGPSGAPADAKPRLLCHTSKLMSICCIQVVAKGVIVFPKHECL
jgi:hypothetical protein